MLLPNLIFIDYRHSSPFIPDLLTALIPKLKDLGYDSFYDELPPEDNVESLFNLFRNAEINLTKTIDYLNTLLSLLNELVDCRSSNNLVVIESILKKIHDLASAHQDTKCTPEISKKINDTWYGADNEIIGVSEKDIPNKLKTWFARNIHSMIANLEGSLLTATSNKQFFQTIIANQIHYQGVDDAEAIKYILGDNIVAREASDSLRARIKSGDVSALSTNHTIKLLAADKTRDKTMASAYLAASRPFFARTGALHLSGLQDFIIANHSSEKSLMRFCFFDLCPNQQDVNASSQVNNDMALPISNIKMSIANRNIDDLADEILAVVKAKIKFNQTVIEAKDDTQASSDVSPDCARNPSRLFASPTILRKHERCDDELESVRRLKHSRHAGL
ncbi:MAG: hypothetical protein A3E82_01930 [Gammaproteobacteria bacterium RIFCSPHIGHO2_12_FULL_38_11]|nr:MAG: hypothetical protein A3E82_01930 [Gammaproteobacteria bacterium RIFCSPHIGHO2_12_FULL_38_11]